MGESPKTPELTTEQQQAPDAQGGIVQGNSFSLLRTDVVLDFFGFESNEDLQRKLQPAFDEADRGELVAWNADEFLSRMHQRREDAAE